MNYRIRELRTDERDVLEDMLYEAIFQPDGAKVTSRDIVKKPEVSLYMDNFGRDGDYCLIAEVDKKVAGGVWVRVWSGGVKGYGVEVLKAMDISMTSLLNFPSHSLRSTGEWVSVPLSWWG